MADETVSINYDGIEELSEIYGQVDMFNTVMETMEEILDDVIGVYDDIEKLVIYRAQLKSGVIKDDSITSIDSEVGELTLDIEEKEAILKTMIGNARAIAASIPQGD